MEAKEHDRLPGGLEEAPFLWSQSARAAGVPQILVKSLQVCARVGASLVPKKMTLGWLRIMAALLVIVVPRYLTYVLLYPIFRLVFGNLYPAYASYKAVRTKNVKEYVSIAGEGCGQRRKSRRYSWPRPLGTIMFDDPN